MYMLYIEPIYLIYCCICTSTNRANLLLKYLIIAILYEPFTVLANAFTTMSVVIHVDTFHPIIARENTSIIKVV